MFDPDAALFEIRLGGGNVNKKNSSVSLTIFVIIFKLL
jgi:hypothetical protein